VGGYLENSREAIFRRLKSDRVQAAARMNRWRKSYGEVGCYPDLVAVVQMLDDLIDVTAKHRERD